MKKSWKYKPLIFLVIGIFIVFILGAINYWLNLLPQNYCKQNPDKCVCEEAKPYCNKGYSLTEQVKIGGYFNNSLNSFWYTSIELQCCKDDSKGNDCQETKDECIFSSKKTQLELDIDDCNNNPREDEKCECIYEFTDCVESCKVNPKCENCESTICRKSRPKTEFELNPKEYQCELWRLNFYTGFEKTNNTYLYTAEALEFQNNTDFLSDIKNKECIKWRNLTDYEKHPEDYVAETKEITTCADPDRNANGSYQVENCGEYNINQTTYRLKNECEKEELYKDIFLKEDIIFAEGFMDYKCGDEFINNGNIVVECSKMIECIKSKPKIGDKK